MALIDKRIRGFELRPAGFSEAEQASRAAMLEHFSAINKFEGIVPDATDKRLFRLLAAGKITKPEYLDLCLTDARDSIQ